MGDNYSTGSATLNIHSLTEKNRLYGPIKASSEYKTSMLFWSKGPIVPWKVRFSHFLPILSIGDWTTDLSNLCRKNLVFGLVCLIPHFRSDTAYSLLKPSHNETQKLDFESCKEIIHENRTGRSEAEGLACIFNQNSKGILKRLSKAN